ncbi:hypothetical protein CJU89_5767 [Yarrowia sp. B02]|nr:hypothetical protein CJU89_5767 [Yarrowia sp. B02]
MKSLLHRRSQSAGGSESPKSKSASATPSPTMIMSPGSRSPDKSPPKSPSRLSVGSVFRRMSSSSPPKSPPKLPSPDKAGSPFSAVFSSSVKKAIASHYSTTPRIEEKGHRKTQSASQLYSSMIIDGEKKEYVRTPVLPEKYPATPDLKTPDLSKTPKTPKTEPRKTYGDSFPNLSPQATKPVLKSPQYTRNSYHPNAEIDPLQKNLKQTKSYTNLSKTKSHTPNLGSTPNLTKTTSHQPRPRRLSADLKRSFDVRRADFTAALEEKKSSLSPNLKKLNPLNMIRRKSSKDDFINIADVYEDGRFESRASREFSARDFSARDNVFTPTFSHDSSDSGVETTSRDQPRDLHPTPVSHDIISSSRDPETGVIYATRKHEWGASPGSSRASITSDSHVTKNDHTSKDHVTTPKSTPREQMERYVKRRSKSAVLANPLDIPDQPVESLRVVKKSSAVGLNILMGDEPRDLPSPVTPRDLARDSPSRASFSFPARDDETSARNSPSRASFASRDSPVRASFSRDSPVSSSRDLPPLPRKSGSRRNSQIDTNTWEVPPRDSRRNSRVLSEIVAESDLVAISNAAESAKIAEAARIAETRAAEAKKRDSVLDFESHDSLSHDTLSRGQSSLRSSNTGHTSLEDAVDASGPAAETEKAEAEKLAESTEKSSSSSHVTEKPHVTEKSHEAHVTDISSFSKQLMAQDKDNSFGGLLEDDSDSAFSFEDDDFGRNSSVRLHKKPERFTSRDLSDEEDDYYDDMYDDDGIEDDAHLYGGNAFLDDSAETGDILPASLTKKHTKSTSSGLSRGGSVISRGASHGRGKTSRRGSVNTSGPIHESREEKSDHVIENVTEGVADHVTSENVTATSSPVAAHTSSPVTTGSPLASRRHSKRLASYHGNDDSSGPVAVTTDDPGYQRQQLPVQLSAQLSPAQFKFPPETKELDFGKSRDPEKSRDVTDARDKSHDQSFGDTTAGDTTTYTSATSSPAVSRHSSHTRNTSRDKRRSYKFPPAAEEEFSFESAHDSSFNHTITEDYSEHDSTAFAYQEVEDALSEIESLTQSGCSSPLRSRFEIPSLGETLGHVRNLSNPSYVGSPSHARNLSHVSSPSVGHVRNPSHVSSPSHVTNSSHVNSPSFGHIRSVSGTQALHEPLEIDTGFGDYDQYGFGYSEGDFEGGGYDDEYYDDLLDEANAVQETYYDDDEYAKDKSYNSRLERSHSNRKLPRKVIHVTEPSNNVVEFRDTTTTLFGLINDEAEEARSIVTTPVNQQGPFDPVSGLPMPGYVELTPISERSYDGDSPYRR